MNPLLDAMLQAAVPAQVGALSRFFRTGPGQYGEGDVFLGIKVPVTRSIVHALWQTATFEDLETCMASKYHEVRLAALLALVQHFRHARKDAALQRRCVEFYLAHTAGINNWDLVDLSCYEILGAWLLDKDRAPLYRLVRDGRSIWEQRIGMVSTMALLRAGQLDDTFALADLFLEKPAPLHDLLQKAAGWMLREAGKRDPQRLKDWLEPRLAAIPRTLLRYAIEKFDPTERQRWLKA